MNFQCVLVQKNSAFLDWFNFWSMTMWSKASGFVQLGTRMNRASGSPWTKIEEAYLQLSLNWWLTHEGIPCCCCNISNKFVVLIKVSWLISNPLVSCWHFPSFTALSRLIYDSLSGDNQCFRQINYSIKSKDSCLSWLYPWPDSHYKDEYTLDCLIHH